MRDSTDTDLTELGDGLKKHVTIFTETGERIAHDSSYLRHSKDEFIVSSDESFTASETIRYSKPDIKRIEIDQHHSRCFITTAVAEQEAPLQTLRDFRDDVLATSIVGCFLIAVYESVSPSIAETLSRNQNARTTKTVRWLVLRCARLADYRTDCSSTLGKGAISAFLVVLYVIGVFTAFLGHLRIQSGS